MNKENASILKLGLFPLLLQNLGVPLGPFAHQFAHNLATRKLGHLVDKRDTAGKALVLGDAGGHPVLDVAGCYFALGGGLERDVGAGRFVVVSRND